MKSIFWILILCLSLPSCAITQKKSDLSYSSKKYDINESIDQVEIDNLENIYILTTENKIIRYNSDLIKKYEYSNRLSGDIVSIDVTNPQKILCFIKDFNRIIVLDNTLAEINTIDLSITNYLDVTAVARSNDNLIWIYDPINQNLVKINNLGEPQLVSNRLSDINLGEITPSTIKEKNNKVALVDESIGILLFDNFGRFLKLIPETYVDNIQLFGDYIFFSQSGKAYQYHTVRYEKEVLNFETQEIEKFKITSDYIYFFGPKGLTRVKPEY